MCAAVLLGLARLAGLSWAELGLGPGTWRRGFAWAGAIIGIVALVLAAGAALPLTRDAFRDSRYHLGLGGALLTSFVLIPVGTVLLEEVAFRGVLWGLLRRLGGTVMATAVSSALFGLWHILPSLGLATDNEAIGSAVGQGRSAQVITVAGTVLFTAAVRRGVLRVAAPQRLATRARRAALGGERAEPCWPRPPCGRGHHPMTATRAALRPGHAVHPL